MAAASSPPVEGQPISNMSVGKPVGGTLLPVFQLIAMPAPSCRLFAAAPAAPKG